MKVFLSPDFVDWLLNYDCFNCRNCGHGVSVPNGETPEVCAKCGGTTFEKVEDDPKPS